MSKEKVVRARFIDRCSLLVPNLQMQFKEINHKRQHLFVVFNQEDIFSLCIYHLDTTNEVSKHKKKKLLK